MIGPEHRLQARVRMYLTDALPAPGYWTSIDHARRQSVQSGQRQKARGIKRGIADVMLWYLGMFHGIELKAQKGRVEEAQDGFGAAMVANGFRYVVIRSVVELDAYLRAAGVPVEPSMRVLAMHHDAALGEAPAVRQKRAYKPRPMRRSGTALDRRVAAIRNAPPKLV